MNILVVELPRDCGYGIIKDKLHAATSFQSPLFIKTNKRTWDTLKTHAEKLQHSESIFWLRNKELDLEEVAVICQYYARSSNGLQFLLESIDGRWESQALDTVLPLSLERVQFAKTEIETAWADARFQALVSLLRAYAHIEGSPGVFPRSIQFRCEKFARALATISASFFDWPDVGIAGLTEFEAQVEVFGERVPNALDWTLNDETLSDWSWLTDRRRFLHEGRKLFKGRQRFRNKTRGGGDDTVVLRVKRQFYLASVMLGRAHFAHARSDFYLAIQLAGRAIEEGMKGFTAGRTELSDLLKVKTKGAGELRTRLETRSSEFDRISKTYKLAELMDHRNRSVLGHGTGCPSKKESQQWVASTRNATLELEKAIVGSSHGLAVPKWLSVLTSAGDLDIWHTIVGDYARVEMEVYAGAKGELPFC